MITGFADLSQIQNQTGDRKAAVGMAFEPDQNDRRAELKQPFRHLERIGAAKETVEHAQTVDLCRQAAEALEPGKGQEQAADLQPGASRSAQQAARSAEAHERHKHGLDQARKRQQGRSLGHGMGLTWRPPRDAFMAVPVSLCPRDRFSVGPTQIGRAHV